MPHEYLQNLPLQNHIVISVCECFDRAALAFPGPVIAENDDWRVV